jgi:protein ImuB
MDRQRRVITAANAAARMTGLYAGMAVTQAQALVPDLLIMDAEPQADREGLERLAVWSLRRYAPIIAVDPPDGLMLDITGAAHAHGGVMGVLKDVVTRLAQVETAARAVCAPAYGAAHALARYGVEPLRAIDPLQLPDAIADLPIAALRLDQPVVIALSKLGLDTIADLEAMPRASLALRFGSIPSPSSR